MSAPHPYESLTPDRVLDAIESLGFHPDGRLLALNSYENRVYQIGMEEGGALVAKFYRPERWSDAAIAEEHTFSLELEELEIPVVPPLRAADGETLHRFEGFRFALFPRRGGRPPELEDPETRLRLGRFLGRLHAAGAARRFLHRPEVSVEALGEEALAYLLEHDFVPAGVRTQYRDLAESCLAAAREGFTAAAPFATLRLHGDCHPGNILWTDSGPHVVDLDDCRNGPAMQDLWMLLGGERREMTLALGDILEGYEEFRDFNRRELHLIEPLRALRLLNYAYWLAKRWEDPAFPQAFPWFGSELYWEEQVLTLREQLLRLEAPALGPV